MRRNTLLVLFLGALVIVLLVVGVVWFLNRNREKVTPQIPTATYNLAKPKAIAQTFNGCPPSGDGGDPVLNTLKNRVDEAQWQPVTFASLLPPQLTWPPAIEQRPRSRWSRADAAEIAKNEGAPVQVEGYLYDAKKMSPETCNCHSITEVDFHIWMIDDPSKDRTSSIVIETTPRVMDHHPGWTLSALRRIARMKEKVRISGWLMMDPEHPDQIGKTRGTIWEIHPIMQIETRSGGGWKPLDNGSTGIASIPVEVAAATAPPVTPQATATTPPESNTSVQHDDTVQIVSVNYDGQKGSNEPDEYVEIANSGQQPVDITDWVLQDSGARNFYKWEGYTLKPGEHIRVYTNEKHSESGGFSFDSSRAIWANSGDVAELYSVDKELISRYAYGNKR